MLWPFSQRTSDNTTYTETKTTGKHCKLDDRDMGLERCSSGGMVGCWNKSAISVGASEQETTFTNLEMRAQRMVEFIVLVCYFLFLLFTDTVCTLHLVCEKLNNIIHPVIFVTLIAGENLQS